MYDEPAYCLLLLYHPFSILCAALSWYLLCGSCRARRHVRHSNRI